MRFIIALCATVSPAVAQTQCAPITEALANLAGRYGESPRVTALMTGGNMLIITAAPSGGWTALEVKPGGQACMIGAGEGFGIQDAAPPGDDS
jgi:hypothetical protein